MDLGGSAFKHPSLSSVKAKTSSEPSKDPSDKYPSSSKLPSTKTSDNNKGSESEKRESLLKRMNALFGSESTDDASEGEESEEEEEIIDEDDDEEEEVEVSEDEEEVIDDDDDDDAVVEKKEGDEELFCICRSSDIERFMIACDHCTEWFHGDCVNVRRKEAKKIEEWFCEKCLSRDSSLKIKYKTSGVLSNRGKKKQINYQKTTKQPSTNNVKNIRKKQKLLNTNETQQQFIGKKSSTVSKTGTKNCQEGFGKTKELPKPIQNARQNELVVKKAAQPEFNVKREITEHKVEPQEVSYENKSSVKSDTSVLKRAHSPEDSKRIRNNSTTDFDDIPEFDENGKFNPSYLEAQMDAQGKRQNRRCGTCASCRTTVDCRTCDYCKDSRKYGGPGKLRQKCRARQCQLLSSANKRCVQKLCHVKSPSTSITALAAAATSSLPTATSSLDVLLSTAQRELESARNEIKHNQADDDSTSIVKDEDTEGTDTAPEETSSMSMQFFDHSYSMPGLAAPPVDGDIQRRCQETEPAPPVALNSTEPPRKKAMKVKHVAQPPPPPPPDQEPIHLIKREDKKRSSQEPIHLIKREDKKRSSKKQGGHHQMESYEKPEAELYGTNRLTRSQRTKSVNKNKAEPVKQCLGPGCVNAARRDSKYCSNECGVQLQIRRLQVILPERLAEMKTRRHVADDIAERKFQELKTLQKNCEDILHELDEEHNKLEEVIERASGLTACQEEVNEEALDSELDLTTYCVSCGLPLGPRIAFKHMEKCWAKLECLMSFGAMMPSAGNLFCDTYMPSQQTYCKRLRVMCPEHFKDRKRGPGDVCGCPLQVDRMSTSSELCRTARLKCTRHVSWERLWRAEIDLKRVHQWWKLEESLEQDRQLRIEMKKRNNVLGVLLHSTIESAQAP